MKNVLLLALLALAPVAARAQYPGAYEEYKQNIANGEEETRVRNLNNKAAASGSTSSSRYNRYDRQGNYIYGSNPNDTPYNTYPGPSLDKAKMARWRSYRDAYKADKARGKANNQAYKADKKAHGGTTALPGGYRWNEKTDQMIKPDGAIVGEKKPPAKQPRVTNQQQSPPNRYPEIDPENSLGKLQEFNRQEEARRNKQGKN